MYANKVHNFLRKHTSEYMLHAIHYVKSDSRSILSNKQTPSDLHNFKLRNFVGPSGRAV